MPYQNVGTPRFYIDNISWLKSLGIGESDDPDIWGFDMSNRMTYTSQEVDGTISYRYYKGNTPSSLPLKYNFCAFLGHRLASKNILYNKLILNCANQNGNSTVTDTDLSRVDISSIRSYDGFAIIDYPSVGVPVHENIYDLDFHSEIYLTIGGAIEIDGSLPPDLTIGRLITGQYYDMPHSPELNLTMSREMDGVKRIRTKGGVDLVNHQYIKPTAWGDMGAWDLSEQMEAFEQEFDPVYLEATADLDPQYILGIAKESVPINGEDYAIEDAQNGLYSISAASTEQGGSGESVFVLWYGKSSEDYQVWGGQLEELVKGEVYQLRVESHPNNGGVCYDWFCYSEPWYSNNFDAIPSASQGRNNTGGRNASHSQAYSRSGRRVWDLSFNYLNDSDVFPNVSNLSNFEIAGYSSENPFANTLLDDNTFFGQVIHKTNGGQLPFIFQPDNTNNNSDQFAIAKFDMNSFKFDQVANGVMNVKVKIREVW